jgi:hypothetical protein
MQRAPRQPLRFNNLAVTLGSGFELINAKQHEHITPWAATQKFQFSTFRRQRD